MAFVIKDRVRVKSATIGTGPIALGLAVQSVAKGYYRTFGDAGVANGDTVPYLIEDGANWETGIGTYAVSGSVLSRTTVINNSAGSTLPISLSGSAEVAIVLTEAVMAMKADLAVVREKLAADRTYYVRKDGSDSHTGRENTAGGAFLTIDRAIDEVCSRIDLGNYAVTIQVGPGTWTVPVVLRDYLGAGPVTFVGDETTPANVTISTTANHCIVADGITKLWRVRGFKLQAATSGHGLVVANRGNLQIQNLDFGAVPGGSHMYLYGAGKIQAQGYKISGSAQRHWQVELSGTIEILSVTVTLTGTPAFSVAFATVIGPCGILCAGVTFSGSGTGKRFTAELNGVIYTGGAGASYFPGNTAGTNATGGQYA